MPEEVESTRPDQPNEGGDEAAVLRGWSRRRFLGRGSLGVVAAGVLTSVPGLPSLLSGASSEAPAAAGDANGAVADVTASSGETAELEQSVVAHVRNVNTGDIDLHLAGSTINVRDPQLALRIARAVR